jgi:type II secretory pathway pseudopilin PulG
MNENPYGASEQDVPERRWSRWIVWVAVFGLAALILVALLLPAVRSAPQARNLSICSDKLQRLRLALRDYAQAHGHLPPAHTLAADGTVLHSWRTLILPYLDEKQLYASIDLTKPWNDPVNAAARETPVPAFACPTSAKDDTFTHYQVVILPEGLFRPDGSASLQEFAAADANTVLVIDAPADRVVKWMEPRDVEGDAFLMESLRSSNHAGERLRTVTADGHVDTLLLSVGEATATDRRAMLTPAKDGPRSHGD